MKINTLFVVIFSISMSCSDAVVEKREFYQNGKIKYVGSYLKDKKTGKHQEFYNSQENGVHYEFDYEIIGNEEYLVATKIFNESGLKTLDSRVVDRDILISSLSDTIGIGEYNEIKIEISNPKYNMISVKWGDYNEQHIIQDSSQVLFKMGGVSNSISFGVHGLKGGVNKVRGLVDDFKIVSVGDSLGVTVVERIPFEYEFYVRDKSTSF